jgi:hypothetical protein
MGLFDQLQNLGRRLKIIEPGPAKSGRQVVKIPTRSVTLNELAGEVKSGDVQALADMPVELSMEFEKVFQAGGIKSGPSGWTIERLTQLLRTDSFKNLDRAAVQKALLAKLAEEKIPAEELVKDAVARDQALDAFEKLAGEKLGLRHAARDRKITEKESQIKVLQEECRRLKDEDKSDDQNWKKWRRKKSDYEKELAWAVGYLLEKPVISVEDVGQE